MDKKNNIKKKKKKKKKKVKKNMKEFKSGKLHSGKSKKIVKNHVCVSFSLVHQKLCNLYRKLIQKQNPFQLFFFTYKVWILKFL